VLPNFPVRNLYIDLCGRKDIWIADSRKFQELRTRHAPAAEHDFPSLDKLYNIYLVYLSYSASVHKSHALCDPLPPAIFFNNHLLRHRLSKYVQISSMGDRSQISSSGITSLLHLRINTHKGGPGTDIGATEVIFIGADAKFIERGVPVGVAGSILGGIGG
ncbi:MAG: hypothetical protein Q9214_000914, partial [Letrouitia sp. 1 TL-2023]